MMTVIRCCHKGKPRPGRPVFRAPYRPGGEPAWHLVAQRLRRWIDHEDAVGTLRLIDTRIAAHAVLGALADVGLSADLVPDPPTGTEAELVYETEPPLRIAVHLVADTPPVTRQALVDLVAAHYHRARSGKGYSVAVLIATTGAITRLDVLVPGCATAAVGDSVRIPPATMDRFSAEPIGAVPADVALTLLATDRPASGYSVLIYALHKDGFEPDG